MRRRLAALLQFLLLALWPRDAGAPPEPDVDPLDAVPRPLRRRLLVKPTGGGSGFRRHFRRQLQAHFIYRAREAAAGRYVFSDSETKQVAAVARSLGFQGFLLEGLPEVGAAGEAYAASSMVNQLAAAVAGYRSPHGGLVAPGTNPGTVMLNPGYDEFDCALTYVGGASGGVSDNIQCLNGGSPPVVPDSTNPLWVLIELDSSNTVHFNVGTAAVNPVMPQPTAGRTVHSVGYCFPGATTVTATAGATAGLVLYDWRWQWRTTAQLWVAEDNVWSKTVVGTTSAQAQFTLPVGVDLHLRYVPGVRLRWSELGTVKYGYVYKSDWNVTNSNKTTVFVCCTSDFSNGMQASPDAGSNFWCDGGSTPPDFPAWFSYTVSTSVNSSGWSTLAGVTARYAISGRVCHFVVDMGGLSTGTSSATTATMTAPIPTIDELWSPTALLTAAIDNGSNVTTAGGLAQFASHTSTTTINLFKTYASGSWTSSGSKKVSFSIFYEC